MADSEEEKIRRILVALDASPHSLAALKLAAELAARLDAELIGIYVEDINLFRLAELQISREVGSHSARVREINSQHIQRQLRAQARRARQALALIAESAELRWSFRTTRGLIPIELLSAIDEADLVILGKAGWSRRRQLGSTAQTLVVQSPRHTLIIQSSVRMGRPVMVIYDGSDAGKKALETALTLREDGDPLIILISAQNAEKVERLQIDVQEWAKQKRVKPEYRWLTAVDEAVLARQVWSVDCGILILPGESEFLPSEELLELLNETSCAVFLVR
ncbi:MAG TPA: universal stress protein [Anaerolineales bacterium]|nr:universal stress protein [Anaerolineales bacterium]